MMNRRRGFSLIEMIAVMGVGSVMLAIAVLLLHTLLQTEGSGRDAVRQGGVIGRLADEFRCDVHAAATVQTLPEGKGWQFDLAPGRTVTYGPEGGGLLRTETADGVVERRESFALPPGRSASIGLEGDAPPQLVSLVIAPADEAADPGIRSLQIDAVLGYDHRFAAAPSLEGESP